MECIDIQKRKKRGVENVGRVSLHREENYGWKSESRIQASRYLPRRLGMRLDMGSKRGHRFSYDIWDEWNGIVTRLSSD